MRGNTFGEVFTIATAGESHGVGIAAIIDGVPAGISLAREDIQHDLDRRRPGQNEFTTPRNEADLVKIQSGVFEDKTTGAPISLFIPNTNVRSTDYDQVRDVFRPGHADIAYALKYGNRDPNGGGRSSFRVLSVAVAAGAIAKKITPGISYTAFVDQIGSIRANIDGTPTTKEIEASPIRCPDISASSQMEDLIQQVQEEGDSIGGCIRFVIDNIDAGLGEPIFNKLHAKLGSAILNINAVVGIEFGDGFALASKKGSEYNDEILNRSWKGITTETNRSGGIQGGISTGMPIVGRVAFHATSSIKKQQRSVNSANEPAIVSTEGRHDPCVLPRAVPAVEAMAALVIADFTQLQKLDRI